MTTTEKMTLWEAINNYNKEDKMIKAQDFLMDYFYWELVQEYNQDKSFEDEYDWVQPNGKFIQFCADKLNDLFQKD